MITLADDQKPPRRRRKPRTPEEYEQRLVMDAFSLAERQIADGTISATVHVHLLKLGSQRAKAEEAKIKNENLLLEQKTLQLKKEGQSAETLEKAMRAFTEYRGEEDVDSDIFRTQ